MKYFAPGRVNLIGEHLDYNGGLVLPAALTIGITATYTPRTDSKIVLRSSTHAFTKEIFLEDNFVYDCNHVSHKYIPITLDDYKLMIMDTRKPRKLIHSKYNERKRECEEALKQIQTSKSEVEHLADAEMYWLNVLNDATLKKRARHVI